MQPFSPAEQSGFSLVHTALRRLEAPAWSRFRHSKDVLQLASDYAGSMEICCKRCLQRSVSGRPAQDQQTIMSVLFKRFGDLVASDPIQNLGDYIIMDLVRR